MPIDNNYLNNHGVTYFYKKSKMFVLMIPIKNHLTYNIKENNLHIVFQEELLLNEAFRELKLSYGCEILTI